MSSRGSRDSQSNPNARNLGVGRGRYSSSSPGPRYDSRSRGPRGGRTPSADPRNRQGHGDRVGRSPPSLFTYDNQTPTTDSEVEKQENQAVKSKGIMQLSLSDSRPRRPGFGTTGTPVTLWANYFQIILSQNTTFYKYNIQVVPTQGGRVPAGGKLRRLVQLFLEIPELKPLQSQMATDFKSILITNAPISNPLPSDRVAYLDEHETVASNAREFYTIRLAEPKVLDMSTILNYVNSMGSSMSEIDKEEMIQALNIIMGHHPKTLQMVASSGANRHYVISGQHARSQLLGGGLEAWQGLFVSVRPATTRILYNVQVKNGAFYQELDLPALIYEFTQAHGHDSEKLERFLKKLRVEVTHIRRPNSSGRTKTILGLASPSDGRDSEHPPQVPRRGAGAKEVKFWNDRTRSYISIYDWFNNRYGIKVNTRLPVVKVSRDNTYLPPDVCKVLPGQPANAMLSAAQTEAMIRFAVRKPSENASIIANSSQIMLELTNENPTLNAFGMKLSSRLVAVPGRVLSPPSVLYRNTENPKEKVVNTFNGSWNMRSIKFLKGSTIGSSWAILCIQKLPLGSEDQDSFQAKLKNVAMNFVQALSANGVNTRMPGPPIYAMIDDSNMKRVIAEKLNLIKNHPSAPKLVLVVLPKALKSNANTIVYNYVKTLADTKIGLHTVCVLENKFTKEENAQYFANVALKFNLKLNGRNQGLQPQSLGIIDAGKTMLASLDVTHPSPGSAKTAPSIAGMVASIDKHCVQFRAQVRIQQARQEMVSGLIDMTIWLLRRWQRENNALPENIIIYRDGVSEGQYDLVIRNELPDIREACNRIYSPKDTAKNIPHITIAIVGKRHHTRFYPTSPSETKTDTKSMNPKNGTIVDRGITEAKNWDFFLQAHTALQGTAKPAHYYVIHDEIFKKTHQTQQQNAADVFERLTHNLCYLFGRATKAVSVCPPAYYADLVCDRARRWNAREFEAGGFVPTIPTTAAGAGTSTRAGAGPGGNSNGSGSSNTTPDAQIGHISAVHKDIEDSMWWL